MNVRSVLVRELEAVFEVSLLIIKKPPEKEALVELGETAPSLDGLDILIMLMVSLISFNLLALIRKSLTKCKNAFSLKF